jgi:hypothetical protein
LNNLDSMDTDGHLPSPSGVEVAAAERAVHSIMGGLKNYSIFPPEHASTLTLLQSVQQAILNFIGRYGDLCLEVGRKRIVYREKTVFEGEASEDNPAFVLYRDGIRRVEFLPGVQESELVGFFQIFNHYRVVPDEPEDDLATALWRAELPHILYEASYELWENEPATDLMQFKPADPNSSRETVAVDGHGWESLRPDDSSDDYQKISLGLAEGEQSLWSLTPDEQQSLAELISADRALDNKESAIRLMFLILGCEDEPQIYQSIVNYLRDEFCSALGSRNFRPAYLILDNFRKIEGHLALDKPWTVDIHKRFQAEIISAEILENMVAVWPLLSSMEAAELKTFIAVLQNLPTSAGITMAGMLSRIESKHARSLIIEIIASYATRDQEVLVVLLSRQEEDLVLRLIRVLRDLTDSEVAERLLQQVKNHPSSKIRQQALRILGRQELY